MMGRVYIIVIFVRTDKARATQACFWEDMVSYVTCNVLVMRPAAFGDLLFGLSMPHLLALVAGPMYLAVLLPALHQSVTCPFRPHL